MIYHLEDLKKLYAKCMMCPKGGKYVTKVEHVTLRSNKVLTDKRVHSVIHVSLYYIYLFIHFNIYQILK